MSSHDIILSQALISDPLHSQLLEKVCASESLKEIVLKKSTSLQVVLPPVLHFNTLMKSQLEEMVVIFHQYIAL